MVPTAKPLDTVEREENTISGPTGHPDVQITITRPRQRSGGMPTIFYIHGGGMVLGNRFMDAKMTDRWAEIHGALVISVEYRLAPEYSAPAPGDDCFTAWEWMIKNAASLQIDTSRIVLAGNSAGGGLAAVTAQRVLDNGGQQPILQLLVYPMLDDRTVNALDIKKHHVWTTESNRFGWTAYLGCAPGSEQIPNYTVPARREDLRGLPDAWIGIGDQDLFYKEDVTYAERLRAAGVEVTLDVVKGAFHGSENLFPKAGPSKMFVRFQDAALQKAFKSKRR
jgi:acetyl esterase/lipase